MHVASFISAIIRAAAVPTTSAVVMFGATLYVGYYGSGNFVQSGGTNFAEDGCWLGEAASGSGAYTLSGSGYLYSYSMFYVGWHGTGSFSQSGGTANLADLTMGEELQQQRHL